MNTIKINCELPNQMLKMNAHLNDYDFVLFHLYSADKEYREYYLDQRKYHPGRLMILDNSAYEFFVKGMELDVQGYMRVIDELKPDIFLLPDTLMDMDATLAQSKAFLSIMNRCYGGSASKPMAVLQGNSSKELITCAELYKSMGITHIAIPFHNSFYITYSEAIDDYLDDPNMSHIRNEWRLIRGKIGLDDQYALGRVRFLHQYAGILSGFEHVHLLGSHQPLEKKFESDLPWIKTMDTGYPVKCGIAGIELGHETVKPEVIIDDFLNDRLSVDCEKMITRNIQKFKNTY
jgi:hypothetical protein